MRIITEHNIAKVNFILAVLVISLITLGVGIYFVVTKYELSSRELGRLETLLIEWQKQELQADVEQLQVRIDVLSRSLQENQVGPSATADVETRLLKAVHVKTVRRQDMAGEVNQTTQRAGGTDV